MNKIAVIPYTIENSLVRNIIVKADKQSPIIIPIDGEYKIPTAQIAKYMQDEFSIEITDASRYLFLDGLTDSVYGDGKDIYTYAVDVTGEVSILPDKFETKDIKDIMKASDVFMIASCTRLVQHYINLQTKEPR